MYRKYVLTGHHIKVHVHVKLEHERKGTKCQSKALKHIWATTLKMILRTCVPSEDADQPTHSRSLIRIFTGAFAFWIAKGAHFLQKMCTLGYPKCTHWKCAPLAIQNAHSENAHPWLSKMHTVKMCTLGYPKFKCTQWRFLSDCANVDNEDWSDCADEQANLWLRWVHMSEGTFSHGMA